MHWTAVTASGGAIRDDFPPNECMGSDDTQGQINHGEETNGGMSMLYFDSHVEFKTNTEIDLKRGVGATGGILAKLKN
jgi:prepilin-type processing-associated H-X9-DG protein